MKIFYMGNNRIGWRVLQYLQAQNEIIVGAVVHPPARAKYYDEILSTLDVSRTPVFKADEFTSDSSLRAIEDLKADIAISVSFDYILKKKLLDIFGGKVINLHSGLLPYNRGQYPNVWSIVEGTPAGVTLHWMSEGVDEGDIIAQLEVGKEATDTGETLFRRLEAASFELFVSTWPKFYQNSLPRVAQVLTAGTTHRKRDVETIDHIDLNKLYTARKLIDIIRARTFPPFDGAYFIENGKKIQLSLELREVPENK